MIRMRGENDADALKKQAMEELSAIGVTFPVHCPVSYTHLDVYKRQTPAPP